MSIGWNVEKTKKKIRNFFGQDLVAKFFCYSGLKFSIFMNFSSKYKLFWDFYGRIQENNS